MRQRSTFLYVLFALILFLGLSNARAGELSAVVNGKSFHLGSKEDWNERNYGFGLEYEMRNETRWKTVLMANGFRDSEHNLSYVVGAGVHRNLYATHRYGGLYVDVGLNAFLMSRKDVDDRRPFPGALPSLTVGTRAVGMNLTYIPKVAVERVTEPQYMDEDLRGIVFLQVKINVSELLRDD